MSRISSVLVLLAPLTTQNGAGPSPEPMPAGSAAAPTMHGHGPGAGQVLFDAPGDGSLWAVTSSHVGLMLSIQGAALGIGYPCFGGQVRFSDTVDVRIQ